MGMGYIPMREKNKITYSRPEKTFSWVNKCRQMHRLGAGQICLEIVLHYNAKLRHYCVFLLCILSLFLSQHILPNAAQMDLRQRKKEKKRHSNRQDRKERGVDYQELRGWEDRQKGKLSKINGKDG